VLPNFNKALSSSLFLLWNGLVLQCGSRSDYLNKLPLYRTNNFRIIAVKLVYSLSGFHKNYSSYRQVVKDKAVPLQFSPFNMPS
jgi:hypothetical protein